MVGKPLGVRQLRALELLRAAKSPLSVGLMESAMRLHPEAIRRVLSSLVARGMIRRVNDRGTFRYSLERKHR